MTINTLKKNVISNLFIKQINWGICIVPTQPFQAALGAESRVYPGNTADRQTQ
jgi:hypothetical protein